MRRRAVWVGGFLVAVVAGGIPVAPAQEEAAVQPQVARIAPASVPSSDRISLDFKDADLLMVLRALAQKGDVNIVAGKDVSGTVTIHLEDVPWETALEVILKTSDLGYDREGNVITVMTVEELMRKRQMERELVAQEPLVAKIIVLKYLDAADVLDFLQPQLSPQGRISVLEVTGQRGWAFGIQAGKKVVKEKARTERGKSRSKALLITDTPTTIRRIESILERVDIRPTQISIEARVMEVDRDLVRDLGLDFATGVGGLDSTTDTLLLSPLAKRAGTDIARFGLQNLTGSVTPNVFKPLTTAIAPSNTGLNFALRRLTGQQFDVVLRTLEEDSKTNTLSAPHIMTLSGQEAKIVVGTKYPILKSTTSTTSGGTTITSGELDYYQDIGIQLYVVPQISGDRHIDLIVHPVVSSFNTTISENEYPVIIAREAETQMLVEDGDTVVLGGLLKDVKSHSRLGIPFLGKIPVLGFLFSRVTTDVEKIDLLVFITARIARSDEVSPEELAQLKAKYEAEIPVHGVLKHEGKDSKGKKTSKPSAKKPSRR